MSNIVGHERKSTMKDKYLHFELFVSELYAPRMESGAVNTLCAANISFSKIVSFLWALDSFFERLIVFRQIILFQKHVILQRICNVSWNGFFYSIVFNVSYLFSVLDLKFR